MNCPNCQNSLRTIRYEGVEIETCDSCMGEWLDSDELGKIVKLREVIFSAEECRAAAEAASITGVVLKNVDRDLKCPKCDGVTDPVNYGGDTGIIIDRCPMCQGFWLDNNELEKIQTLVEGWQDMLPEDLEKYSEMLHDLRARLDEEDDVQISRFKIINVILNGILDVVR